MNHETMNHLLTNRVLALLCLVLGLLESTVIKRSQYGTPNYISISPGVPLFLKDKKDACQTWIFVLNGPSPNTELHFLADEATQKQDNSDNLSFASSVYSVLRISDSSPTQQNVTFFDREIPTENILKPLIFGTLRFTPNGMCTLVPVSNVPGQVFRSLNELLLRRVARPHNDFFFFVGERPALVEFSNRQQFQDIRFKYGIWLQDGSDSQSPLQDYKLLDFCALNPEEASTSNLRSRSCPSLVNGKHFRATSTLSPGMVRYVNNPETGRRISGAGIYFIMLEEASFKHNFTFDIQYSGFGGASGFKKDGVWKGAIGEVFSREADVAFATGVTVHRHHVVDATSLTSMLARVFYIRKPSVHNTWRSIFWPLHSHVWIGTLVTILTALPTYHYIIATSQRLHQDRSTLQLQGGESGRRSAINVPMTLLQVLLEQGLSIRNWKWFCMRLLLIIWIIFAYVIGTGYRGNLVSFLTFLEREEIPKTHLELSLSNFKLLFRYYGGIAYLGAVNSPDPKHKRIIQKSTLVNTSQDCIIPAILDKNVACLDYDFTGDFAIATNGTYDAVNPYEKILVRSVDTDSAAALVWAFRKYSPLIEFFDKVVLRSHASGLLMHWTYKDRLERKVASAGWLKKQKGSQLRTVLMHVAKEDSSGPAPLTKTSLHVIFVTVLLGYVAGLIAFMFEVVPRLMKKVVQKSKFHEIHPLQDVTFETSGLAAHFPRDVNVDHV